MLAKRLALVSILFFISACTAAQNSVVPTIRPTIVSTLTPTLASTPTPTSIPSTAAPSIQMNINKICWNMKSLAHSGNHIKGSLLYFDPVLRRDLILSLDSLKTKTWNYIYPWAVSPDGNMIARYISASNTLHLISQSQAMDFQIPSGIYSYDISFLSDNRILLPNLRGDTRLKPAQSGLVKNDFYILSILTGDITHKTVVLPDYYQMFGISGWSAQYSPDFRYVIYPTLSGAALENIDEQKVYWNASQSWSNPWAFPVWRPDSSSITVTQIDDDAKHSENLYQVSIDGQVTKLTELQQVLSSYSPLYLGTWSQNGRYLWFATDIPQTPSLPVGAAESLFIFDSETNTILNPCVSFRFGIWPHVWSPDSNYFAFVSSDVTQILILDITNQTIYQAYKQPGVDFVDPWASPLQSILGLDGWLSWENP